MNNNQDHVNRLLNMQKILQQVQKNKESEVVKEDSKIEVVDIDEYLEDQNFIENLYKNGVKKEIYF